MEVDIKHGVGAGVRTVVSFVLHVYAILNMKAYPILFLDEAYSYLSEHYVERFFTFMKGLCESKDFMVVLISHDVRFHDYADKSYHVADGHVKQMK